MNRSDLGHTVRNNLYNITAESECKGEFGQGWWPEASEKDVDGLITRSQSPLSISDPAPPLLIQIDPPLKSLLLLTKAHFEIKVTITNEYSNLNLS
jgi:hypothetical protein